MSVSRSHLRSALLLAAAVGCTVCQARRPAASSGFPRKPIKVVVYTGPGGLIDVTARKFTEVAARHTDAVFVIENCPGAGGIVAVERLLQGPADGHLLLACTKSNIAKLVSTGRAPMAGALDWLGMLMADPECVITRRSARVHDWATLVPDALRQPGEQVWVGPAAGGLDHVTAMKIWARYGLQCKWVPFKSGGKALAALLGGQGVAYVGNPRDVVGRPDLAVAVVAAPSRLTPFPDVPTFAELGAAELSDEYMWRGFAVKKGTPQAVLDWYDSLFARVCADARWHAFWADGGMDTRYRGRTEFTDVVKSDLGEFKRYLEEGGVAQPVTGPGRSQMKGKVARVVFLVLIGVAVVLYALRGRAYGWGNTWQAGLALTLLIVAAALERRTWALPATSDPVGAAVVPRLWAALLGLAAAILVWRAYRCPVGVERAQMRVGWRTAGIMGTCIAYVGALPLLGYFADTLVFGGVLLWAFGRQRALRAAVLLGGWLLFAYLVFVRLLHVPLPTGRLWEQMHGLGG